MPVKPDLERLRWFAALSDRSPSPFFTGRDAEIAAVGKVCAMALADARQGRMVPGTTRLFHGAPGAGKSALLAEMGRRWTSPGARKAAPLPVVLGVGRLNSEEAVVRAILEAVAPGLEEKTRTTDDEAVLGVPDFFFGIKGRKGKITAPKELTFDEMARVLPPRKWRRPVALLVDEIQTVQPEAENTLLPLHLGEHGLPVVPVLVGLGSARAALWHTGITRLSDGYEHGIAALSGDEAMQAVERMLDEYRVDRDGDNRPWASWLAERSEGWPQHLHNGMAALAADLVRTGGVLREVDGDAVAKLEKQRREESYGGRISDEMGNSRFLVGALFAGLTGADGETPPAADIRLDSGEVINRIRNIAAESASSGDIRWEIPPGMDATAFFEHMVHKGVFHQDGRNGPYRCPIPSLASYLVRNGAGMGREPGGAVQSAEKEVGLSAPSPFD